MTSKPRIGVVDPMVESQYSYGSRAGVWRIYKAFKDRGMILCLVSRAWKDRLIRKYGVASALVHSPKVTKLALEYGFECGSHGGRWIQHATISPEEESAQIASVSTRSPTICSLAGPGSRSGGRRDLYPSGGSMVERPRTRPT